MSMHKTIPAIMRAASVEAADAPFLLLPDGQSQSYGAFWSAAGRVANFLVASGVKPGDRVALQADKSVEALLVYFGTLRAGAVFLPLNTAYTLDEVRYFLADAEPALFICRPDDEPAAARLCAELKVPGCLSLGTNGAGSLMPAVAGHATEFPDVACQGSDLAAILYTSGTTGRSKGAMLTHDNLSSNALTLVDHWRFTSTDRLLHALPIFHAHGLFVGVHTIVCARAAMYFLPRLDVGELLRLMPQATTMMGVPTFYTRLLDAPGFTREVAAGMRLFISGSAPLSAETHREFSQRTGHAILERYGMTETTMITSNPYDGARVAGSVGRPLPGIEVRIADPESGKPLPAGEAGVIEVRGPNVFAGYWQMPEKTAQEFRSDGFFITGDLGRVDEHGYIHIVGRAKDLIISGGFNVYPAEVEALLDAIPGIAESAVIGVPHRDFGEGVVAIVQSRNPALREADVMAALEGKLAKFKQPKRVVFVPELPRNTMGKVQKVALRQTYAKLLS